MKQNEDREKQNKLGLVILLGTVSFSFVWFFYIVYFSPAVDLEEVKTSSLQAMNEKGDESIDLSKIKDYWRFQPELVLYGEKLYQTSCASCHGNKGLGDGIVAKGLQPPPRNLVEGKWKKGGSSIALYKTLVQGISGTSMVSFSYLSKLDRWALVHYIRSITKNKVKDDEKKLEQFFQTAQ